jgi:hypothetical protein
VILNQRLPTNTEATANSLDKLIKNEEEKAYVLIGVALPANRNVTQKDAEKNSKIREFVYRDTTNAKYNMFDLSGKNWSF